MRLAGLALAALLLLPAGATAQDAAPCDSVEAFHRLDFWVGEWDVYAGDVRVGTNRIEKVLDGCAVAESWADARGGRGRSLFYYHAATDVWKQVWVTGRATAPGGVKEKTLVEVLPDGGVRFQGTVALPGGGSYLDRTTLTPLAGGRVRQVIETSPDGGATWERRFDAEYVPASSDAGG